MRQRHRRRAAGSLQRRVHRLDRQQHRRFAAEASASFANGDRGSSIRPEPGRRFRLGHHGDASTTPTARRWAPRRWPPTSHIAISIPRLRCCPTARLSSRAGDRRFVEHPGPAVCRERHEAERRRSRRLVRLGRSSSAPATTPPATAPTTAIKRTSLSRRRPTVAGSSPGIPMVRMARAGGVYAARYANGNSVAMTQSPGDRQHHLRINSAHGRGSIPVSPLLNSPMAGLVFSWRALMQAAAACSTHL